MFGRNIELIVKSKYARMTDFMPRDYKTFFMLNSTEHEISNAHKKLSDEKIMIFLALKPSHVPVLLINVKMPTIVGILTFMSRIYFVLS